MNAKEYESYVAEIVSQLDVFSSANVSRNKQFDGIRQPGKYEIDISVEFLLSDALHFLLIIECKNWARPIDRPVVQKLIQTRDAISAHKAALVSPVGFTKEAIEVAEAQGVALWVIAEKVWHPLLLAGLMGKIPIRPPITYSELRLRCVKSIGYDPKSIGFSPRRLLERLRACSLLLYKQAGNSAANFSGGSTISSTRSYYGSLSNDRFSSRFSGELSFVLPSHDCYSHYIPEFETAWFSCLDDRTAIYEICNFLLAYLEHSVADELKPNPLSSWRKQESEQLQRYGLENDAIEKLLHAVRVNNEVECESILNKLVPLFSFKPKQR